MKILDKTAIDQKVKRLAYEIYENNLELKNVVFFGVNNNGKAFAELLIEKLNEISGESVLLGLIQLNPASPTSDPVTLDLPCKSLAKKNIIVVDDVANTGRTLYYAMQPLMQHLPKSIEVAVLIDRKHKLFPIAVRYVGLSLATTLKENISVKNLKKSSRAAFLE